MKTILKILGVFLISVTILLVLMPFILFFGRHSIILHTLMPPYYKYYTYDNNITADKNNILMWQTNGKDSGQLTWKEGEKYCKDLKLSGYDDWRLPSNEELIYLGRTISYLYFDGYYDWYWTNVPGSKVSFALRVSGSHDTTDPEYKKYVRCVRNFKANNNVQK